MQGLSFSRFLQVKFVLQGSHDENKWAFVGSSDPQSSNAAGYEEWGLLNTDAVTVDPGTFYLPKERGATVTWSFSPAWDVYINYCALWLGFALVVCISLGSAVLGREGWVHVQCSVFFGLVGVLLLISAINQIAGGRLGEGLIFAAMGVVGAWTSMAFVKYLHYFDMWFPAIGVAYSVLFIILHFHVRRHGFSWGLLLAPGHLLAAVGITGMGLTVFWVHRLILQRGVSLVRRDKIRFERVWNAMLEDPDVWDSLDRLKKVISHHQDVTFPFPVPNACCPLTQSLDTIHHIWLTFPPMTL